MTREDITRMAREADKPEETCWLAYEIDFLERFTALVRAAEREACAKVCEDMGRGHGSAFAEFDCVAAIRARGQG